MVVTVPDKKVGGYLIWQGFETMEPIDRLNAVWERVEAELTPEERRSISAILTLTPEEATTAKAG